VVKKARRFIQLNCCTDNFFRTFKARRPSRESVTSTTDADEKRPNGSHVGEKVFQPFQRKYVMTFPEWVATF
jgi:hypothetical protein